MPELDRRQNLGQFHGITPGTVTASKALVVDSNKDLASLRNLTITGALTAGSINGGTVETGTDTATSGSTSGSATVNKLSGIVTTGSMSVSSGGTYTLTLSNSKIAAGDILLVSLRQNTLSGGVPVITYVNTSAGSANIIIYNLTGTLTGVGKIHFYLVKV